MKLTIVFAAIFCYLLLTFACGHSSEPTAMLKSNEPPAASAPKPDGVTPPHAVDIDGKVIPPKSVEQPMKPIILAKDSKEADGGELKKEAAFDHVKHSTLAQYSVDGKAVLACTECHHTDQPKAPAGQEYLKEFERTEILTTEQLTKSKQEVKSCRECHYQKDAEPTEKYPPSKIEYPAAAGKRGSRDFVDNYEAYHLNCNTCHDAARKRAPKSPAACADCHVQKKKP